MLPNSVVLKSLVLWNVPRTHAMVWNLTGSLNYSVLVSQRCCRTHSPLMVKAITFPLVPMRTRMVYKPEFKANHKEDKVNPEYRMVYYNTMWRYYEYGRFGALTTALPVIIADIAFFSKFGLEQSSGRTQEIFGTSFTMSDPTLFVSLSAVFMLGLLYATLKVTNLYMTRMYYDPNKGQFIGIKRKGMFSMFKKKQLPFTLDDVKPIPTTENPFVLLFKGNFSIKGNTFLLNENDFTDTSVYRKMAGDTYVQQYTSPYDDIRTINREFQKRAQHAQKRHQIKKIPKK